MHQYKYRQPGLMSSFGTAAIYGIIFIAITAQVFADISIYIADNGSNMLVTYGGSLNVAGLPYYGTGDSVVENLAFLFPNENNWGGMATSGSYGIGTLLTIYELQAVFESYGGTSQLITGHQFGDMFEISAFGQPLLVVPTAAIVDSIVTIGGSFEFLGANIASCQLYPGIYIINDSNFTDNEAIRLYIVPEPSAICLLAIGMIGCVACNWRNIRLGRETAICEQGRSG